jgi:glutamine amidotransferase PdxT
MAATFHPELTEDTTVHERFVKIASGRGVQDFVVVNT